MEVPLESLRLNANKQQISEISDKFRFQNKLPSVWSFTEGHGENLNYKNRDSNYVEQLQKYMHDDNFFKNAPAERYEAEPIGKADIGPGFLFVSGNSVPICAVKERKVAKKPFKAPLPKAKKTKESKKENYEISMPLQGFGCTNIRARSVSNVKDSTQEKPTLPSINPKTVICEEEEIKEQHSKQALKRGISQVTRRQLQINRSLNDQKPKRKVFTVNTYPSRSELETLQLVIK